MKVGSDGHATFMEACLFLPSTCFVDDIQKVEIAMREFDV